MFLPLLSFFMNYGPTRQRPLVSTACLVMSCHLLRSWARLFSLPLRSPSTVHGPSTYSLVRTNFFVTFLCNLSLKLAYGRLNLSFLIIIIIIIIIIQVTPVNSRQCLCHYNITVSIALVRQWNKDESIIIVIIIRWHREGNVVCEQTPTTTAHDWSALGYMFHSSMCWVASPAGTVIGRSLLKHLLHAASAVMWYSGE